MHVTEEGSRETLVDKRIQGVGEAVCLTISVCSQSDGVAAPHPTTTFALLTGFPKGWR